MIDLAAIGWMGLGAMGVLVGDALYRLWWRRNRGPRNLDERLDWMANPNWKRSDSNWRRGQ